QEGRDYLVKGSKICLLRGREGRFTVRFFRFPAKVSVDNPQAEIDCPKDVQHLLPLLVASYFWLDDREDLAAHYLSLYRAEAAECGAFRYAHNNVPPPLTNGWDK
ncbi:MAG: hypothetical protein MJ078_05605, partial [Clostridia bacterium]|nr:hypothetical protein [Clostridia bacterium]